MGHNEFRADVLRMLLTLELLDRSATDSGVGKPLQPFLERDLTDRVILVTGSFALSGQVCPGALPMAEIGIFAATLLLRRCKPWNGIRVGQRACAAKCKSDYCGP